jgi:quinol-cytochrome oxidoreductase complex cytochrome b subunit
MWWMLFLLGLFERVMCGYWVIGNDLYWGFDVIFGLFVKLCEIFYH